jgi:hypothetical protein
VGNLSVPINYSTACLNPAGHCDTGVGFSQDGVHFADFNSSFGVNPGPGPSTGDFIATAQDFRYLLVLAEVRH